jgi:prepilin-type N-terminal cleavage/methylation domain-containing protein
MTHQKWKKDSKKNRNGFTLIELSVVIVIIGIIIATIATVLPSLIVSSKIKKARAILEKIDAAIQGYSIANHRLPFAASTADGIETDDIFIGYLPYHSLGLSTGQDPWGNAIRYAVYGVSSGASNLTTTFADADAFCAALTQASTANFDPTIAHTTTASACASANSTNSNNQAYILVSGGPKDMDGAAAFLDGCNGSADPTYNAPDKIMDTTYDDLVYAFSINELIQRICGGGTGGGIVAENAYTNGCTNGVDDDGDGNIDCSDPDCTSDTACTGGGTVTITTTTIPSADLNSSYSTTISASGGVNPYEWTLSNNGGLSGLSINTFTGLLTGIIDQCPGTYNISVDVQDSTPLDDGGPLTDSRTLPLQITSSLAVSHTSGSAGTITWTSTLQEETFQANGSWLGTLNWTLNSNGATGFTISPLDGDSAVLKKTGASSVGSYTFTITATDSGCSTNHADISLNIIVQSTATGTPGGISGIIDTHTYTNPNQAFFPSLISMGNNVYTVSHQTEFDDGYLRSIFVASDGTITTPQIDATFFNYANGTPSAPTSWQAHRPDSIKVSDTISAVVFSSALNGQGRIHTISVDSAGQIGTGYLQGLTFESNRCNTPKIVHVTGNIYAIVYSGADDDGWIKTVTINDSTGVITATGHELEFDTSNATQPVMVQVDDSLFAVAYRDGGGKGAIKSLSIDDTGSISTIDSLSGGFDIVCYSPSLILIDSTTLAVAYQGPQNNGWLKTISIDAVGSLSSTTNSLEFDANDTEEPGIVHMGADIYAIFYSDPRGNGVRRGHISTVSIASGGTIGTTVIDNLQYEDKDCYEPSIVSIDNDTAAVFYRGTNNVGTLVTIGFQ